MKLQLPDKRRFFFKSPEEMFDKQNRLLDYIYDVDKENRIVTAKIHFASIDDIIDPSYKKNLMLNDALWQKMEQVLKSVPFSYKVNFEFEIDDMKDYSLDVLMAALEKNIDMKYLGFAISTRRKRRAALSLTAIGILLLLGNIILQVLQPFNGVVENILVEIIDIAAWVFVWEAVTIYYIDGYEMRRGLKNIRKRILDISFTDSQTKNQKKEDFDSISPNLKDKIKDEIKDIVSDFVEEKKDTK